MSLKILFLISDSLKINPSELLINKESDNKSSIY